MGCSSSKRNAAIRVVVVGGSYGGITAAQALDAHVDVTVVEKRQTMNHNIANLRAALYPETTPQVEVPYTNALKNGRVIQGEVVDVRDGRVILRDGQQLPYEYLIIATGRRARSPGKLVTSGPAASQEYFTGTSTAIQAANHITIIGGGAVGLELAGEIRAAYPSKRIVVVNGNAKLLANEPVSDKFLAKLSQKLTALRIEVMLNERIERPEGADDLIRGHTTLTTASGKSIETDLQIWTIGAGRAVTEPFTALCGGAIDAASGRIRVNPFLQVQGLANENVYSVGDCALLPTPEQSLAYFAGEQAKHAASNILLAIAHKARKAYKAHPTMIMLTLGPNDGIAQTPMGIMGGKMTSSIKSKGLFGSKFFGQLGAPYPKVTLQKKTAGVTTVAVGSK